MRCTTKNLSSTLRQKRAEPHEYDTNETWQRRRNKWAAWILQDEAKNVKPMDDLKNYAKDIRHDLGFKHGNFFDFLKQLYSGDSAHAQAEMQELQELIGDINNYNADGTSGGEVAENQDSIQNLKTSISRLEAVPKDPTAIAQIIEGEQEKSDDFDQVVAEFKLTTSWQATRTLLVKCNVDSKTACSVFIEAINDKIDHLMKLRKIKIDRLSSKVFSSITNIAHEVRSMSMDLSLMSERRSIALPMTICDSAEHYQDAISNIPISTQSTLKRFKTFLQELLLQEGSQKLREATAGRRKKTQTITTTRNIGDVCTVIRTWVHDHCQSATDDASDAVDPATKYILPHDDERRVHQPITQAILQGIIQILDHGEKPVAPVYSAVDGQPILVKEQQADYKSNIAKKTPDAPTAASANEASVQNEEINRQIDFMAVPIQENHTRMYAEMVNVPIEIRHTSSKVNQMETILAMARHQIVVQLAKKLQSHSTFAA